MSIQRSFAKRLRALPRRLFADVRAATAVEYGLIVSLVVIASVAALIQVAGTTGEMWNNISNKVEHAR